MDKIVEKILIKKIAKEEKKMRIKIERKITKEDEI
jgi:hypothetical protein